MSAELGLGMAALGRPGYVTLTHATDLAGNTDPAAMEANAHDVLDAAYDNGIRYIDAARSYGKAEDFLASWLRKRTIKPGEITIASKWGYTYTANWSTTATQHEVKDHSLAAFNRQLAESVDRLGPYLSLYQIHSVTADGKTLDDVTLIDAIARLHERGIRTGLSVSGPGQAIAIARAIEVRRGGERVFDSVQATWNLLERGAESALAEAHSAGMSVVVKEVLANGRLTSVNQSQNEMFASSIARIDEIAKHLGTTIDMLALGAAVTRPWADVVLTGAATVTQVQASAHVRRITLDSETETALRPAAMSSPDYWKARSSFSWN